MAQVTYLDPIDHLSGKIAKKHRTTYNYRVASGNKFTSVQGKRSTPFSAAELARQAKFAAVVASTYARMQDAIKKPIDQAAFKAQSKYTTLYGYVFSKEWADYEE